MHHQISITTTAKRNLYVLSFFFKVTTFGLLAAVDCFTGVPLELSWSDSTNINLMLYLFLELSSD